MATSRKLAAVFLPFLCWLLFSPAYAQIKSTNPYSTQHDFVVTLLGTGNPVPSVERFGTSTLVQAGGKKFLFDAGRGSLIRLWQLGLTRGNLDAIFLTHLHSDHTVGLADLLMTGWVMDSFNTDAGASPLVIYGPQAIEDRIGTTETLKRLRSAFAADEYIRKNDEKLAEKGLEIVGHDISPGVVYDQAGIKITAFKVDHGDVVEPALGYRVDYDGRSVLLSGDTRYSPDEPLLKHADGLDVLIHEVADSRKEILENPVGKAVMKHHTLPQEAGQVFTKAQPKLAVYSHLVLLQNSQVPAPDLSDVIKKTRETYQGPLLVGSDLTSIIIDEDEVTVREPSLGLLPVAP